jgi:predicted enzyme related to lactoylglutathione lyase
LRCTDRAHFFHHREITMPRTCFIELPTGHLDASKRFYASAFGWEMTDFGPSYACTMTGDVDVGLQGDLTEASRAPLPVISVDDLQAALAAVEAAGGKIVKPIFGFPGGRRFHFTDPHGNELAVLQAD